MIIQDQRATEFSPYEIGIQTLNVKNQLTRAYRKKQTETA